MKQYYVSDGSKKKGPFTIEQLKQGGVKPDYLVWCEGMDDWIRASEMNELKGLFPPPIKSIPPLGVNAISDKEEDTTTTKLIGISGIILSVLMGGTHFILASLMTRQNRLQADINTMWLLFCGDILALILFIIIVSKKRIS